LTDTFSGLVDSDTPGTFSISPNVAPTLATTATSASDVVVGGYPITVSGAVDPDYNITYVTGTLTITRANQTVSWSNPAAIIVGTPLSSTQLNATVSVVGPAPAGALTYTPPAGTVLGVGSGRVLSVTAAATQDYNAATATVTINVLYCFSGFLPPLNKNMSYNLGRTIPIKFQLCDVNGALITSLSAVSSLQIQALDSKGNPVGAPFNPTPAGNTALRNDGSQYIFNWQTKGLTAGSYEILLTLADSTVKTVVIQLTTNHSSAGLTTVSGGGTGAAPGGLLGGNVDLYVDNGNGYLTADEMARIQDVVTAVGGVTAPYGVAVTEVTDPTLADVTLNMDTTSAVGGYADGVLGCTTDAGRITIITGWNFYAGSDATQIRLAQYDFQTVVTHELGHALGLGHSSVSTSVMYATLNMGTVNRSLAIADLNVPDSDTTGACGLHAAALGPGTVQFSDLLPSLAGSAVAGLGHPLLNFVPLNNVPWADATPFAVGESHTGGTAASVSSVPDRQRLAAAGGDLSPHSGTAGTLETPASSDGEPWYEGLSPENLDHWFQGQSVLAGKRSETPLGGNIQEMVERLAIVWADSVSPGPKRAGRAEANRVCNGTDDPWVDAFAREQQVPAAAWSSSESADGIVLTLLGAYGFREFREAESRRHPPLHRLIKKREGAKVSTRGRHLRMSIVGDRANKRRVQVKLRSCATVVCPGLIPDLVLVCVREQRLVRATASPAQRC
jgi:hypothetical protein